MEQVGTINIMFVLIRVVYKKFYFTSIPKSAVPNSWGRILLEKLIVAQVIKLSTALYGT
jgi:hypothetical protein